MAEPRAWTDDELSAFLDGELSAALTEDLLDALERDEALGLRLAELTEANAAASAAFDAPLNEPIPDRLRAILEGPAAQPEPDSNVVSLAQSAQARRAPAWADWRLPMAASVALVVGGLAGAQLSRAPAGATIAQIEAAVIAPANPLHRVLSESASATAVTLAGGAVARPVLSFRDRQGRLCREFEMAAARATAVGIACRAGDDWRVELLVPAADRPDSAAGYVQASGYNEAAVEAVLSRLGAGEALSAEDEAAALATR